MMGGLQRVPLIHRIRVKVTKEGARTMGSKLRIMHAVPVVYSHRRLHLLLSKL